MVVSIPVTAVGRLCFPLAELCVSAPYFIPSASVIGTIIHSMMKGNKQQECMRVTTCHWDLGWTEVGQHASSARHIPQLSVTAYVEEDLRNVGTILYKHFL